MPRVVQLVTAFNNKATARRSISVILPVKLITAANGFCRWALALARVPLEGPRQRGFYPISTDG